MNEATVGAISRIEPVSVSFPRRLISPSAKNGTCHALGLVCAVSARIPSIDIKISFFIFRLRLTYEIVYQEYQRDSYAG